MTKGCLKQGLGANDVRMYEDPSTVDRTVNMGLRCEVHNDVGIADKSINEIRIADITVHKI